MLRQLRTDRGLSVEEVTRRLLFSPTKISRLETGRVGASPRDIRDLCDLYRVTDPDERKRLMTLAREGKPIFRSGSGSTPRRGRPAPIQGQESHLA